MSLSLLLTDQYEMALVPLLKWLVPRQARQTVASCSWSREVTRTSPKKSYNQHYDKLLYTLNAKTQSELTWNAPQVELNIVGRHQGRILVLCEATRSLSLGFKNGKPTLKMVAKLLQLERQCSRVFIDSDPNCVFLCSSSFRDNCETLLQRTTRFISENQLAFASLYRLKERLSLLCW